MKAWRVLLLAIIGWLYGSLGCATVDSPKHSHKERYWVDGCIQGTRMQEPGTVLVRKYSNTGEFLYEELVNGDGVVIPINYFNYCYDAYDTMKRINRRIKGKDAH